VHREKNKKRESSEYICESSVVLLVHKSNKVREQESQCIFQSERYIVSDTQCVYVVYADPQLFVNHFSD
jgi:hypothetical protein